MFLVGDVGGTKVNLALCEVEAGPAPGRGGPESHFSVRVHSPMRYSSPKFKGLAEVILRYVAETHAPVRELEAACFGVPGPVVEGKVPTVNLPWDLDAADVFSEVSRSLPLRKLLLINDLEATAHGLRTLSEGRGLLSLRKGTPVFAANQALLAPGTGLGEAVLFWDGHRHVVSASEGGHTDFGPQDEEQVELLRWLWPRHKHVSWEHVASGPAIHRIYRFLKETGREKEPSDLAELFAQPDFDPSPTIGHRAQLEPSGICARTMDLWMFCLGAEAGNLALKTVSRGGVYIGGGIVPNIIDLLRRPAFFRGLDSKGRMSPLVHAMPVLAVTDPYAALYGAALAARKAIDSAAA